MRGVLAIVGGLVAGAAAMVILAYIGGMIFPSQAAIDPYQPREIISAFETMAPGAKAAIILSWFGGALVGALAAKIIARQAWAAWVIAALFAIYVLASVLVLPMPAWMQVVAVAAPLIGGLIANQLVKGAPPAALAEDPAAEI